ESPASAGAWMLAPVPGMPHDTPPWTLQTRLCADSTTAMFVSSLPAPGQASEHLTGILRSAPFDIPSALTFWLAGHSGFPGTNPPPRNFVRLRDAQSHEVLAEATPPRNDVAQRITWDLHHHVNHRGYLEIIDGDDGPAYAWLALGRLDPPVVPLPA